MSWMESTKGKFNEERNFLRDIGNKPLKVKKIKQPKGKSMKKSFQGMITGRNIDL